MDSKHLEPATLDRRAQRARTILIWVMLVLIVAPFVIYFLTQRASPR